MTNRKLLSGAEKVRLNELKKKVGLMSSDEALDLAAWYEGILKHMPVYDVAYRHTDSHYRGFLEYASLLCDNGE